jgi:hypothetical protein
MEGSCSISLIAPVKYGGRSGRVRVQSIVRVYVRYLFTGALGNHELGYKGLKRTCAVKSLTA